MIKETLKIIDVGSTVRCKVFEVFTELRSYYSNSESQIKVVAILNKPLLHFVIPWNTIFKLKFWIDHSILSFFSSMCFVPGWEASKLSLTSVIGSIGFFWIIYPNLAALELVYPAITSELFSSLPDYSTK